MFSIPTLLILVKFNMYIQQLTFLKISIGNGLLLMNVNIFVFSAVPIIEKVQRSNIIFKDLQLVQLWTPHMK